ncbi:MAG: alpha/beta hydrolase, partial [Saprospiraceae bacterium]|nr:alpha/beta hydrolase [Saprospiraceae bacterium]
FIQHGKSNLTHKRYLNMEHNFFEVGEDGRADHTKGHWKEVMQAFLDWTVMK